MAGINHLYDIYTKDPKFVEGLLNGEVEIEEKLQGSRFGFEVVDDDVPKFYKRNDTSPITKIDRTLARYYEKAISHFESFTTEKLSKIPERWRFGFEYFPNLMPVKIAYDRMPLNHLVLTDITVRDPHGKVMEVITDKETLDEWAKTLEVESSPQIFKGKLDPEQRKRVLDFLNTPPSELVEKFKTENFAAYFLKVLNPKVGKTFLQNSLDKDIEALVFKFDGKNPLKVMNPSFALSKEQKKAEEKPSDIYSLTLVLFQEFFQNIDMKKIKLKEKGSFEERYIEFISKAFNLFCKSPFYVNNFAGDVDFDLPDFLTREEASVNFKFVTNPETLELLKARSVNRELFKIMMASMRAHKKKPFGFFKKELIWYHNQLVDKIADYIDSGLKENLLAFQEFKETFLVNENIEEWEEYGLQKMITEGFPTYAEVKKPARAGSPKYLEVLQKIAQELTPLADQITEDAAVVVCPTAPYHNGIVTALRDVKGESGCKSILCMIGIPFNELDTYREVSQSFLEENKDLLHTILVMKSPNFSTITSMAKQKNLKIKSFCGAQDSFNDFRVQSGLSEISHIDGKDNLETTKPMQYLRSGDIEKFKKICVPLVHNSFYKLRNSLTPEP
jgi:hypothetical protein